MKIKVIFILSTLSVTINGVWWVGVVQPVLLSFGALMGLSTIAPEILDVQPIQLNKWLKTYKVEKEKKESGEYDDDYEPNY